MSHSRFLVVVSLCIVVLTGCLCAMVLSVRTAVVAVPAQLQDFERAVYGEVLSARLAIELLPGQIAPVVDRHAGRITDTADARLASIQADVKEIVGTTVQAAQSSVDGTLQRVDVALARIAALQEDISPGVQHLAAAAARVDHIASRVDEVAAVNLNCRGNGACWPARITGILGGTNVLLGESAQAARRFDAALPVFLAGVDRIVSNSDESTAATARVMKNFATATKPLPAWVRIGLSIAPPVAQVGASVATAVAVTGRR